MERHAVHLGPAKLLIQPERDTIEGFWSQFKRGGGTFQKVTAKYLPRYVAEFEFRCNNRMNPRHLWAAVATVWDGLIHWATSTPSVRVPRQSRRSH
ncbi:MAG: transposase [Gemmatimonadaceae bacterium]